MSDTITLIVPGVQDAQTPVGEVWNPTVTLVESYGIDMTFQFAKHSGTTFHYYLTRAVAAKIHTEIGRVLGLEEK
jgi:hypothetical protein